MGINAAGSQAQISAVSEVTAGTTPATPVFKKIRATTNDLMLNKDALLSDERRNDRMITDVRHGNKSISGNIAFEFSNGNFDDYLEMALQGTWTANVLKVGTTLRTKTFERFHADIAAYLRYLGCAISTFGLSVVPNKIVTGTFGVVGMDKETDTVIITGATYTDPNTDSVMDSFSGTITEAGSPIGYITGIDLALDNGIEGDMAVGSDIPIALTSKRSNLTGTVTAFFQTKTLMDKFINETESSITFALTDGSATYTFTIPKVKYMGAVAPVADDGSIVISLPFQAIWDSVENTSFKIERSS